MSAEGPRVTVRTVDNTGYVIEASSALNVGPCKSVKMFTKEVRKFAIKTEGVGDFLPSSMPLPESVTVLPQIIARYEGKLGAPAFWSIKKTEIKINTVAPCPCTGRSSSDRKNSGEMESVKRRSNSPQFTPSPMTPQNNVITIGSENTTVDNGTKKCPCTNQQPSVSNRESLRDIDVIDNTAFDNSSPHEGPLGSQNIPENVKREKNKENVAVTASKDRGVKTAPLEGGNKTTTIDHVESRNSPEDNVSIRSENKRVSYKNPPFTVAIIEKRAVGTTTDIKEETDNVEQQTSSKPKDRRDSNEKPVIYFVTTDVTPRIIHVPKMCWENGGVTEENQMSETSLKEEEKDKVLAQLYSSLVESKHLKVAEESLPVCSSDLDANHAFRDSDTSMDSAANTYWFADDISLQTDRSYTRSGELSDGSSDLFGKWFDPNMRHHSDMTDIRDESYMIHANQSAPKLEGIQTLEDFCDQVEFSLVRNICEKAILNESDSCISVKETGEQTDLLPHH